MPSDVAIDQTALEQAIVVTESELGTYSAYANDLWRRDTGVGNPVGRTALRVMLESAMGQALMRIQAETEAGLGVTGRLREVVTSFEELDASLSSGWDVDYVADLT